jgi:hypothetical protein
MSSLFLKRIVPRDVTAKQPNACLQLRRAIFIQAERKKDYLRSRRQLQGFVSLRFADK